MGAVAQLVSLFGESVMDKDELDIFKTHYLRFP